MPFHYKILLFHLGTAFFRYFSLIGLHGNKLCAKLCRNTQILSLTVSWGNTAREDKSKLHSVQKTKTRRAVPAPSARRSAVKRGDARSPRLSAGYGGDVVWGLRGAGVTPSRFTSQKHGDPRN